MKVLFYCLMLIFPVAVNAQAVSESNTTVQQIKKQTVTETGIIQTTGLDQNQVLSIRSSNGAAWLELYQSVSRDKTIDAAEKNELLEELAKRSTAFIQTSWQYRLIQFLQSGKKDISVLKEALELSNDKAAVYPYLIQYAIVARDSQQVKFYVDGYSKYVQFSPAIYQYHYNALMSVDEDATIYARGLNDLVPMAVLQQQYSIRKDVKLRDYDGTINNVSNAYLALTVGQDVLKRYPGAVYSGLMIKLSGADNKNSTAEHVNSFNLEVLQQQTVLSKEQAVLYQNYLPGFILLYKQKLKDKAADATTLYKIIINIARQAGNETAVLKLLAD